MFRYREVFTGALPYRAKFRTWTLNLGEDGDFSWVDENAEGDQNSLIEGRAKPLLPTRVLSRTERYGVSSKGAGGVITLRFDDSPTVSVKCAPHTFSVLEAGAVLRMTSNPSRNANRAVWTPSSRRQVTALGCDRTKLEESADWSDEPQPTQLALVAEPGIEYAHDNDDMVVQKGGLRWLPE